MPRGPKAAPVEREQRELERTLTEPERTARADSMKQAELDIEKKKSERSVITRAINQLSADRNKLAHVLEAGSELRMVSCTWVPDYGRGVKSLIADDTGELITSTEITADERQTLLTVVPDAEPDEPPVPAPTRGRRGATHTHADPATT